MIIFDNVKIKNSEEDIKGMTAIEAKPDTDAKPRIRIAMHDGLIINLTYNKNSSMRKAWDNHLKKRGLR